MECTEKKDELMISEQRQREQNIEGRQPTMCPELITNFGIPRDDGAVQSSKSSGSLITPRDDGPVHPSESSGTSDNPMR